MTMFSSSSVDVTVRSRSTVGWIQEAPIVRRYQKPRRSKHQEEMNKEYFRGDMMADVKYEKDHSMKEESGRITWT